MANLTVNTKKYGQITLNTKPHSDPPVLVGTDSVSNQSTNFLDIYTILNFSGKRGTTSAVE